MKTFYYLVAGRAAISKFKAHDFADFLTNIVRVENKQIVIASEDQSLVKEIQAKIEASQQRTFYFATGLDSHIETLQARNSRDFLKKIRIANKHCWNFSDDLESLKAWIKEDQDKAYSEHLRRDGFGPGPR